MGMFSKNESKDFQQTQEIKEATMPPSLSSLNSNSQKTYEQPSSNQNPFQQQEIPQKSQQQEQFVNPFQQQVNQNSTFNEQQPNTDQMNSSQPMPQMNAGQQSMQFSQSNLSEEKIQELVIEQVEKVIAEKWEGITENIEVVVQWKDKVEKEIDLIKHDIVTIKEGFEQFEKRLLNKINTYDRNILDVNSEMKALEKVFNKITPTLVNNVNELSSIAKELRGVKNDTPEDK